MVKRKAEVCLDSWVERGVPSTEGNNTSTTVVRGRDPPLDCPTVDERPLELKDQPETSSSADVADREGTNLSRFWLLLK